MSKFFLEDDVAMFVIRVVLMVLPLALASCCCLKEQRGRKPATGVTMEWQWKDNDPQGSDFIYLQVGYVVAANEPDRRDRAEFWAGSSQSPTSIAGDCRWSINQETRHTDPKATSTNNTCTVYIDVGTRKLQAKGPYQKENYQDIPSDKWLQLGNNLEVKVRP